MNLSLKVPPPQRARLSLLAAAIFTTIASAALGTCPESPLGLPNVFWEITDSLSACPAGDSVLFSHSSQHKHPSKLRIKVVYQDADCNARSGVRPESIWVVPSTFSGTATINDQPDYTGKIFADDSTNIEGVARFTIPSVSGCGKLQFQLYVSGQYEGFKRIVVRTLDSINVDGGTPCNLCRPELTLRRQLQQETRRWQHRRGPHRPLEAERAARDTCSSYELLRDLRVGGGRASTKRQG
jgi:hypothetical protein